MTIDRDRAEAPADADDLSFDEGVEEISDLISPDDTDPDDEIGSEETDDAIDDDGESDDLDDDDNLDEEIDEDEETEDETADPTLAPEDALVQMKDGRKIPVSELRDYADNRVTEMQRQFTKTQTEYSERSKRLDEATGIISQERDYLIALLEQLQPRMPDKSMRESDPFGYQNALQDFQEFAQHSQQLRAGLEQQRQHAEQQRAETAQRHMAQEQDILLQKMPDLRDATKAQAFHSEIAQYVSDLGGDPAIIDQVDNHLFFLVVKDALAFRKLKSGASKKAQKAVEGKPKMLRQKPRRRGDNKVSRQKRNADRRLRETGSFDAGVAALENLDL